MMIYEVIKEPGQSFGLLARPELLKRCLEITYSRIEGASVEPDGTGWNMKVCWNKGGVFTVDRFRCERRLVYEQADHL